MVSKGTGKDIDMYMGMAKGGMKMNEATTPVSHAKGSNINLW